jgi:2'-5' RNA ligase
MKTFAIFANIKLSKKPDWLDDFRVRLNQKFEYHVTLIQPRIINEDEVSLLKQKLGDFFDKLPVPEHMVQLTFNSLYIDEQAEGGACIMINASNNSEINSLQKTLLMALGDYTQFVTEVSKSYEQNFHPHLTIAQNLSLEQNIEEVYQLDTFDCSVEGKIVEIVLTVVDHATSVEADDPKNQTTYKL